MIIDPSEESDGMIFILLRPDNRVLLMLRDENSRYFSNTWTFPGGACDYGEGFLAACIREAHEEFEANLQPNDCKLIMKRLNNHSLVYVCKISNNNTLKQHEGKDMSLKTIEELKELELGYEQADIVPVLQDYVVNQGK
ncbi:MAG: NUDIX domain-containing protein [Patescibacteria group bacterium]